MKTIFETNAELEVKCSELGNSLTKLTAEYDTLVAENKVLQQTLNDTGPGVSQSQYDKVILENKELQTNQADLVQKIISLEAQVKDFESKVADKALEIVASTGTPIVEIQPTVQPASMVAEDVLTTFKQLKGIEARKFWEQHQKELHNQMQKH